VRNVCSEIKENVMQDRLRENRSDRQHRLRSGVYALLPGFYRDAQTHPEVRFAVDLAANLINTAYEGDYEELSRIAAIFRSHQSADERLAREQFAPYSWGHGSGQVPLPEAPNPDEVPEDEVLREEEAELNVKGKQSRLDALAIQEKGYKIKSSRAFGSGWQVALSEDGGQERLFIGQNAQHAFHLARAYAEDHPLTEAEPAHENLRGPVVIPDDHIVEDKATRLAQYGYRITRSSEVGDSLQNPGWVVAIADNSNAYRSFVGNNARHAFHLALSWAEKRPKE
jgi:hypothetical protein